MEALPRVTALRNLGLLNLSFKGSNKLSWYQKIYRQQEMLEIDLFLPLSILKLRKLPSKVMLQLKQVLTLLKTLVIKTQVILGLLRLPLPYCNPAIQYYHFKNLNQFYNQ
jgi:hypothetical protein